MSLVANLIDSLVCQLNSGRGWPVQIRVLDSTQAVMSSLSIASADDMRNKTKTLGILVTAKGAMFVQVQPSATLDMRAWLKRIDSYAKSDYEAGFGIGNRRRRMIGLDTAVG